MNERKSFLYEPLKCFGISRLSLTKVEVLEGIIEGKHSVVTCTLTVNNEEIPTHALIYCGATGIILLEEDFNHHHQIPLQELKEKTKVEVIDRRCIEPGDIPHLPKVGRKIQVHKKQLPMFIMKLGQIPIVLGFLSLRLHDVATCFSSYTDIS